MSATKLSKTITFVTGNKNKLNTGLISESSIVMVEPTRHRMLPLYCGVFQETPKKVSFDRGQTAARSQTESF